MMNSIDEFSGKGEEYFLYIRLTADFNREKART
jgi:hypothetical protein